MRTFEEILRDITKACNHVFYSGYKNVCPEILEAATKIYIAEMQKEV